VSNIPDLPVVIVVPVHLIDQFVTELHKFLEFGNFDVIPYLGTWASRTTWWKTIWGERLHQLERRRIIVAAPKVGRFERLILPIAVLTLNDQAIESDFDCVLEFDPSSPSSSAIPKAGFADSSPSTLYGRRYLLAVFDEAHNYRNIRKGFFAARALVERSQTTAFLTATPGVGRASVSSPSTHQILQVLINRF
jgi:hypothetical protein